MELRVTCVGSPPYFITKPNGDMAGFELDTVHILAEKVGASLKAENNVDWLNYKFDENGTMEVDEYGYPILIGTTPEIFYQRATFGVAEHYYIEVAFPLVDYIYFTELDLYFRGTKPQVGSK